MLRIRPEVFRVLKMWLLRTRGLPFALTMLSSILAVLLIGVGRTAADVTFIYDDAGRLVSMTDSVGNSMNYTYDAAGNLMSVATPPPVAIYSTSPSSGRAGTPVTIVGRGFSATPSQNTVTFSLGQLTCPAASVSSSTSTSITTSVPNTCIAGNTLTVTTPSGAAQTQFLVTL